MSPLLNIGTGRTLMSGKRQVLGSLYNNLMQYWPLQESSGVRYSSYGGVNLTPAGGAEGVLSATGVSEYIPKCAAFNIGLPFSGTRNALAVADQASLSFGNESFSFAYWVKIHPDTDLVAGRVSTVAIKFATGATYPEYSMGRRSTDELFFAMNRATATAGNQLNTGTTFASDVWYFVYNEYNASTDIQSITVNMGTPVTVSYTFGCFDGSGTFSLGGRSPTYDTDMLCGYLAGFGVWRRVLTSNELQWLYNDGKGGLIQ